MVLGRVKIPPHNRAATTPRSTVQDDYRFTFRITASLDVNLMATPDLQHHAVKGID
jgi:hypothetical protein